MKTRALGSGFVVDKAGYIVTNFHVVEKADTINVSFASGDEYKAKVVGKDQGTDIAVLKVEQDSLTALPLGDSKALQVGDYVVIPPKIAHGWEGDPSGDAYLLIRRDGPADQHFLQP